MHNRTTSTPITAGIGALIFAAFALLLLGCGVSDTDKFVGLPESGQEDGRTGQDTDLINVFDEAPAAPTQAALPVREADYSCPEAARYATDGKGRAYCLFDELTLPDGQGLTPVCQHLSRNYVGFGWDAGTARDGYACPQGATYAVSDEREMCLFDELPLPLAEGLRPECFHLQDGIVGFSWETETERGDSINDLPAEIDSK